jgi:hypothetical protein
LHRGNWNFIKRQAATIARTYTTYEPLKTFTYLAAPFLIAALLFLGRAFYVYVMRQLVNNFPQTNDQALVIGGTSLTLGFVIFLFGIIADRLGGNRRLIEEVLYRIRREQTETERWRRDVSERLDHLEHAAGIDSSINQNQPPR